MAESSTIRGTLFWLGWLALLSLWTAGLLLPDPRGTLRVLPEADSWHFLLSKLSHFGVYCLLAALTRWLPLSRRGRVFVLVLVACHAALGEFLQLFVPSRTASVRDVAIDLAGIALGTWATWQRG